MARPRRRFLRLLLILIVIAAAAAAIAPMLPIPPVKNAVENRLSELLGRKVTIASARLNIVGGPYLTLTGMAAQEDPAFGNDLFLRADEVRAEFDVIEYLRTRKLVIDSLILRSPQINLVKNANGVWSWTTLGNRPEERSTIPQAVFNAMSKANPIVLSLLPASLPAPSFKKLRIENASVKMIDRTASEPREAVYKDIALEASLAPSPAADSAAGATQAKGQVIVQSEQDGTADLFKSTLPFDLNIGRDGSALFVSGSIGPGPIETKNLELGSFTVNGEIHSENGAPLTGAGQLSATEMFIRTINVSEQVARALRVEQIGDMSPGTGIASLESDFHISKGTFSTANLRIQQLDGLGDATAQNGSFKIESALTVNYSATINLSPDATSRVKSVSPMWGLVVTILETNNRVSVPINIIGDVRQPEITVDVSRIF